MAAEAHLLCVERREGQPYAIIWLQREPVNAMSLGLWRALAAAVERLEADPQVCERTAEHHASGTSGAALDSLTDAASPQCCPCPRCTGTGRPPLPRPRLGQVRGCVIASGLRRDIFTAGQDLREIYAPLTSQEKTRCAASQRHGRESSRHGHEKG